MMNHTIIDIEVEELFTLPVEDRKKVIDLGVDMLFQQVLITGQLNGILPSVLLNQTLSNIESNIQHNTESGNYELAYYFTEVFWETNKRLEDLRKENKSVFL